MWTIFLGQEKIITVNKKNGIEEKNNGPEGVIYLENISHDRNKRYMDTANFTV